MGGMLPAWVTGSGARARQLPGSRSRRPRRSPSPMQALATPSRPSLIWAVCAMPGTPSGELAADVGMEQSAEPPTSETPASPGPGHRAQNRPARWSTPYSTATSRCCWTRRSTTPSICASEPAMRPPPADAVSKDRMLPGPDICGGQVRMGEHNQEPAQSSAHAMMCPPAPAAAPEDLGRPDVRGCSCSCRSCSSGRTPAAPAAPVVVRGQHVIHDALSVSCADNGSIRAAATSPRRPARSTTSGTRPTAARPALEIVFYFAGSTTRLSSTGGAGLRS